MSSHPLQRRPGSRLLASALLAPALLASSPVARRDDELSQLLERTRAATKSTALAAHTGGLLFHGEGEFLAVASSWSFYLGADGRAVERIEGRLPRAQGRDARGWWTIDWARAVREPIGRERALLELEHALLRGELWAASCAWQRRLGERSTPEEMEIVLTREDLPRHAALWVARASALPLRLEISDIEGPTITHLEEWSERLDFRFPTALRTEFPGGGSRWTIRGVDDAPAFLVDPTERPSGAPAGTRFDPDLSAEIEIQRAPTKHLLTRARIDDGEPRWFLLDSGAGALVIDKRTADALELDAFGAIEASGIGGRAPARFRPAKTFEVGPLTIEDPVMLELDLSPIAPFFGVELAGILGYDVFARAVIEVDLKAPAAKIHDPESFGAPSGTRWEELLLDARIPTLRCRYEGDRDGLFRMDTGDSSTVTFHTPTVERLKLLDGRKTKSSPLGGVGGFTGGRSGKLAWFEVGGRRVEDLDARFAEASSGPLSTPEIDGNLGTALLEPFVLFFDYRSQRMGFVARR
ncbi:MAG: retropepsin-like domain-containing protein [Planctomycetes bacterium]|nr:retropepsin-like domain-containing protein [Planctomycetota bacterium]